MKSRPLSIIALVVALVALLLSVTNCMQISTVDERIGAVVENSYQELATETQEQLMIAEIRTELLMIRSRILAEEVSDEIADDVDALAEEYEQTTEEYSAEMQEFLADTRSNLYVLSSELRSGSANALNTVEQAIEETETELRPDKAELCTRTGGEWRTFSNACADKCNAGDLCAQVITDSCDCGEGMCWNGAACEPR